MTELRDARFKRALQAAPDAQLGPQEATRRAVRDAAAKAVARFGNGSPQLRAGPRSMCMNPERG